MRITVSGTFRRRTRINLWLFTIAGRWEETPFRWDFDAGDRPQYFRIARPIDGLEIWGSVAGFNGRIEARLQGFPVQLTHFAIYQPSGSHPFQVSPIKGVELKGTIDVVAPNPAP